MENQEMQMPAAMPGVMPPQGMPSPMPQKAMVPGPDQMAIFDQMRQQISPQEFTNEMLAGGAQVDPQAVAKFTQALDGLNMPPEVLNALNDMVDAILAEPQNYQEMRPKFIEAGVPANLLPEQFDPQFFAALNMAVDQMLAEPVGVQAFAQGGIAELKPIAKAIASYGRNGDTMLAHITPAEARMLRRRGGSGTINPDTGLPEFFFDKIFKAVGDVFKGVGDAISGVVNGIVDTVKEFASSTVGKIVTTIALGFFLGPAAASFLGVTSSIGVAAVSGFIGSAGSTLAAGGNIGDALKAGAVGGLTAGAGAGILGGTDAFAANSYSGAGLTPGEAFQGQVDKFKQFVGLSPTTGQAPVSAVDATSVSGEKAVSADARLNADLNVKPTATIAATEPANLKVNSVEALDRGESFLPAPVVNSVPPVPVDRVASVAAPYKVPTVGESFSKIGEGIGLGDGPANFKDFKQGVGDLFAPSGASTEQLNAAAKSTMAQNPGMSFETALKQASSNPALVPSMFRTYAPAAAAGLGVMSLAGGFDVTPLPESPEAQALKESSTDRMKREGTQRLNYLQNLPGVVYDQFGQPVSGSYNPFPTYTPPSSLTASAPSSSSTVNLPPVGSTPYQAQPFQPYNTASAYSNLAPRTRMMAQGGIAGLAAGGYPRRTGKISGPGTEKSDSIPAMLSDGEFVMTASAVRGAGKGSRREGAKRMYKLMHQLEKNSERG